MITVRDAIEQLRKMVAEHPEKAYDPLSVYIEEERDEREDTDPIEEGGVYLVTLIDTDLSGRVDFNI